MNNSSGGYRPENPINLDWPRFPWPPRPLTCFKWLCRIFRYLWPWPALFMGVSVLSRLYLVPDATQMTQFAPGWVASLFIGNLTLLVLFAGAWHLRFYTRKAQGIQYKYNSRWLSTRNPRFLFGDQVWDNIFWNICSAVPIWTVYEGFTFWLQANGFVRTIDWHTNPIYCGFLVLLIPLWLSAHFYFTHRLIHWPPLYKSVHYIHHKNINIGPWSSLAMHPVEHAIYFSAIVPLWFMPSYPLHTIYLLMIFALGPATGHLGFDAIVLNKRTCVNVGDYMHYLHHKYFTVNFGTAAAPFDKWLGTFHDGSDEATESWKRRMRV
jgi:sterol desaturase/sphingolipid hydroxylase (fatty acid hydroxylase superfamily)